MPTTDNLSTNLLRPRSAAGLSQTALAKRGAEARPEPAAVARRLRELRLISGEPVRDICGLLEHHA